MTVGTPHRDGASEPSLDVLALRRALGSFVTGVTVVTTLDAAGEPQGMTANSFTSVSLKPPLVLICVRCGARCHDAFSTSAGFVVHILGHDQEGLAATFASPAADRWTGRVVRPGQTGAPVISECIAWLDCVTEQRLTVGDHLVVIGRVVAFDTESRRPLAFCQGSFLPLDPEVRLQSDGAGHTLLVRWLLEVEGRIALVEEQGGGLTVPQVAPTRVRLNDDALVRQAQESFGVRPEIPTLYSIFDDHATGTVTIVYRARASLTAEARPPDWRLVDPADVPWPRIGDPALRSMIERFVGERTAARFGIYAGSAQEGRVSVVTEG